MKRQIGLTLTVLVFAMGAYAQRPVMRPLPNATRLSAKLSLVPVYEQLLKQHQVPPAKQQAAVQQFSTLDPDFQRALLVAMDEKGALGNNVPTTLVPAYRYRIQREWLNPHLALRPTITMIWPTSGGNPNEFSIVFGARITADIRVLWDGVEQPTSYCGPEVEFFPNTVGFRVPAGTPLGTNHTVKLRNIVSNAESNDFTYRVVAPRGYRGIYGWQFSNFGDPLIPWAMYRDFFGASAVEYSGGTHRPAAQAWYDSAYKGVGNGGNCYGMSNSSLRLRNGNMTTYHQSWFTTNPQDYTWLYPWCTQTKQTVQEDQGGQLSAEMAATINDYWNHQDHKTAWTRINNLVSEATNRPVIGFWYVGHWGHAVVGYKTSISGSQRRIIWYDNNEPYSETESGGTDKSWAYVDWNNNSFHANSYATANKMVCLSYAECMRPPHLPTEAGGPGASTTGTVVAVVEGGQVEQIQDENGRRFYAAPGVENTDPNTRLPEAMRYLPAQAAGQEYQGPAIFIFNRANNKSLTFTVAGGGQKSLSFFQPGNVFVTDFAGQGQLRFGRLLTPQRTLELPNPAALQPSQVRLIHVLAADRVLELQNLNLGNQPASIGMADDNNLQVQTGAAARFDLRLETFANNAVGQRLYRGIATEAASRALLTPQNWNALGTTALQLNLRNLNNQPIRQLRLNQ